MKYDHIGRTYARVRQPDRRIEAQVLTALGDAASVLNVGAGAGSYEPRDRPVVAVEPSRTMITQRPVGSAPAVQAVAGALPFRDGSFDAAMASLTIHHWPDWRRGIAEMKRVAAGRVVVFTFDPAVSHACWMVRDYFPGVARIDTDQFKFEDVAAEIGGTVSVVPVPWDCSDGFLAAYWRRPERYLEDEVRAGISGFQALPEGDVREGLRRLAEDLRTGEWERRYGDLLPRETFDGGYRLIVSD